MRFIEDLSQGTQSILQRIYKYSQHYRVRQRAHCILLSSKGYTLIIPLCSMSPKFLKLLKRGHENASRGSLANPPLASICA